MADIDNAAASSTPASSGAPSSTAIGERSSGTASEALIKAATAVSSPVTPAGGAEPAKSPVTAGASPTGTTQPAIGAQPTGETTPTEVKDGTPEARITAATRNAREKVVQEYGGYQPKQVQSAMALVQAIQTDPVGFVTQIIKDVQAKGFQIPGMGAAPTQAEELRDFPDPDIETTDGKIQGWSRDSVIKALNLQKQQILGELRPVSSYVEGQQERAQAEERANQSRLDAAEIKAKVEQLPHYKEHETAIAEKLRTMAAEDPESIRKFGVPAALYHCYTQVLAEKVFPKVQETAEAKVREDFSRKAATSTGSAYPITTGGGAQKPQINNQRDLAAHMERLAATMGAPA